MTNNEIGISGKICRIGLMCTSAMAGLAFGAPAAAQTAGQTMDQVVQDAGEIIVTARQRKETLLEAPVAVSAIDAETLGRFGATDTRDLAKLAPSLTIERSSSGGGGVIALRGIGTSPSNAGFDQAVSINVDGIQTGRSRIIELGMLDLAQVEVMKGPQALFFGKNSPAGVISITSAAPTREFEGYARVGYEFVADEVIAEGAVSGPLSDAFSARIAVRYRTMDGWLRNNAGQLTSSPFAGPSNLPQAPKTSRPGDEDFIGRVSLAFEPEGSDFSATLKVAGMVRKDDGPSAGQQLVNCGAYDTPVVVYAGVPAVAADPFGDCKLDRNYSNGALPNGYADNWPVAKQNPYSKTRMFLSSLTANYDFENLSLTSVTGFFYNNSKYFDNFDATVYMAYDAAEQEKFKSFSQEFRLLSSYDSPVNFMIGAYYQNTNHDFYNGSLIAPLPLDAATGKYHTWEKPGKTKGNTYSVFGQLLWNIVPELELAGGVRYTHETKDSSIVNTYAHPPLAGTVLTPVGKVFADDFKDSNYSPEATLTWRPTNDLTTYVAYKTGYKSGGFGISTNLVPASITIDQIRFKSEKIEGFEGGVKARLLDRMLTVTAAAFTYKYSNLQVNSFNPATTSFSITNAAAARIKGFEMEFSARPHEWLTLNGAIAYSQARYLDYLSQCWGGQTAALGCNVATGATFSQQRAGKPLSRAPDWTATFGFNLDVPAGEDFIVGLSGNTRYSDSYYAIENNNPYGVQGSFWLLDASVRVKPVTDRWEVALIGRNLTNEYYTSYMAEKPGAPAAAGADTVQIMGLANRGRQIMLQGTVKF